MRGGDVSGTEPAPAGAAVPVPAPLWLRLAAAGLNLVLGFGVMAAFATVLEPILPSRERREQLLAWWEPRGRRWQLITLWSRIRGRTGRSWRFSPLGLRTVDARTGGPMTVSSALREEAFSAGLSWAARRISGPGLDQYQARRTAAEAAVRAEMSATRVPEDAILDEQAVAQAVAQRMSADNGCLVGCGSLLAVRLFAPLVTIPFTRRRQSLGQLVAGVMVVRAER